MQQARRRSSPAPAARSWFRARKRASPSSGVRHSRRTTCEHVVGPGADDRNWRLRALANTSEVSLADPPEPSSGLKKRRQKGDGGGLARGSHPASATRNARSQANWRLRPRTETTTISGRGAEAREADAPPTRESSNQAGFRPSGWRDPDSNRGHHDFQSCGPGRGHAAKSLEINGFAQAGRLLDSPAICRLVRTRFVPFGVRRRGR
jgi:hypothetical protein